MLVIVLNVCALGNKTFAETFAERIAMLYLKEH